MNKRFLFLALAIMLGIVTTFFVVVYTTPIPQIFLPAEEYVGGWSRNEGVQSVGRFNHEWIVRDEWINGGRSQIRTIYHFGVPVWRGQYYDDKCVDGLVIDFKETVQYGQPFYQMYLIPCP